MMEKYGVEKAETPKPNDGTTKVAAQKLVTGPRCDHPYGQIKRDGEVSFCTQCGKYL